MDLETTSLSIVAIANAVIVLAIVIYAVSSISWKDAQHQQEHDHYYSHSYSQMRSNHSVENIEALLPKHNSQMHAPNATF